MFGFWTKKENSAVPVSDNSPRLQKSSIRKHKKANGLGAETAKEDAFLLLFSTSWCGPSKLFIKEIREAGIDYYTLIDCDKNEDLPSKYSVRNIPTTILINKKGEVIKRWVGYEDEDPGQTAFVNYIKNCGYNILPYNE